MKTQSIRNTPSTAENPRARGGKKVNEMVGRVAASGLVSARPTVAR